MDLDLNGFREPFFEEAAELIESLETGLLRLERHSGDPETLHAAFRAAHSIKGAAGMLDMKELSRFTHSLESLLDGLRGGEVALDRPKLSLLLRATDTLRETSGQGTDSEQGRGFAVVAAEVRKLAQRSATSAKEIKLLINDSVAKVGKGSELVNLSGRTLTEIVTSARRVSDIMSEIAGASAEHSAGLEQVNRAVCQMDSVTQSYSSQTEELASTAMSLSNSAHHLQTLVARFTLGGENSRS